MKQTGFVLFIFILFIFLSATLSIMLLDFMQQESQGNALVLSALNASNNRNDNATTACTRLDHHAHRPLVGP